MEFPLLGRSHQSLSFCFLDFLIYLFLFFFFFPCVLRTIQPQSKVSVKLEPFLGKATKIN